MLGESFIYMYEYRKENIPLKTISTLLPAADKVESLCTPTQKQHEFNCSKDLRISITPPSSSSSSWSSSASHKPRDLNSTLYANLSQSYRNESLDDHQDPDPVYVNYKDGAILDFFHPQHLRVSPQVRIPDDGYLVMDSSITLNGEQATDSMLNGYLDRKLQEVYSQYMQERLACPGSSPASSLLPSFQPTSIVQISSPLTGDPTLEPEPRPSQGGVSSHFSSPVLRISNAEPSAKV